MANARLQVKFTTNRLPTGMKKPNNL